MSRFDLHPAHIDGLVNASLQFGLIGVFDDLTPVGQMLLRQHQPHRDTEQEDGKPSDYAATVTDRALHPIAVLCLLDCYEYQASGTIGWRTSEAHGWTQRLREKVLTRLPDEAKTTVRHGADYVPAYRLLASYTQTPWGITELDQIPELGDGVIEVPVIRKGLRAEILTGPIHCPNNGLSSRVRYVTILSVGKNGRCPPSPGSPNPRTTLRASTCCCSTAATSRARPMPRPARGSWPLALTCTPATPAGAS
jgi:hypothetical protein